MTLAGLIGYLSLNVLFGTLGHSGVEPFPPGLRRLPVLRLIGTSTFHAEHHEHPGYNFGFYTLFWDKLFGTLDPDYGRRFDQQGKSNHAPQPDSCSQSSGWVEASLRPSSYQLSSISPMPPGLRNSGSRRARCSQKASPDSPESRKVKVA